MFDFLGRWSSKNSNKLGFMYQDKILTGFRENSLIKKFSGVGVHVTYMNICGLVLYEDAFITINSLHSMCMSTIVHLQIMHDLFPTSAGDYKIIV